MVKQMAAIEWNKKMEEEYGEQVCHQDGCGKKIEIGDTVVLVDGDFAHYKCVVIPHQED